MGVCRHPGTVPRPHEPVARRAHLSLSRFFSLTPPRPPAPALKAVERESSPCLSITPLCPSALHWACSRGQRSFPMTTAAAAGRLPTAMAARARAGVGLVWIWDRTGGRRKRQFESVSFQIGIDSAAGIHIWSTVRSQIGVRNLVGNEYPTPIPAFGDVTTTLLSWRREKTRGRFSFFIFFSMFFFFPFFVAVYYVPQYYCTRVL